MLIDRNLRNQLLGDCAQAKHRNYPEGQRAISWLRTCDTPYRIRKPDYPKVHLSSYAMIRSDSEFLLVFHAKARAWIPIGGHLDYNELSKDAIHREVTEEIGILPDYVAPKPFFVTSTDVRDGNKTHTDVSFWHLVELDRSKLGSRTIDYGEELRWFSVNELLELRDRSGLRPVLRALGVVAKTAQPKSEDLGQILI